MTRLFVFYWYAVLLLVGWSIALDFAGPPNAKRFWTRLGASIIFPIALMTKRGRKLLFSIGG